MAPYKAVMRLALEYASSILYRGAYVGEVEEMMCVSVCVLQRGNSSDEFEVASTLFKYDLKKGDLFVPCWTRVHPRPA